MSESNDAFKVLGWGLRRYLWFIALCILAFGVLVPMALDRGPTKYEAQAQVGPTGKINLQNLNPLPRLATSVFNNGAVASAVRDMYTPPLRDSVSVIPSRVSLVAAQDNIVFSVIGHGKTATEAQNLANVAATRFTLQLNNYAGPVGSFAVQQPAAEPAKPNPKLGGPLTIGLGLMGGLIVGVGLVGLLLLVRRPVASAVAAEEVTGAPVFARVRLMRHSGEIRGLPQLSRLIQTHPAQSLLLAGSHATAFERHQLADKLSLILRRSRRVRVVQGGRPDSPLPAGRQAKPGRSPADDDLLIIQGPTEMEVATRSASSLIVLVVQEGVRQSALVRLTERYLDGGPAGVVMVRHHHWHLPRWLGLGHGIRSTAKMHSPGALAKPKPADSRAK
ncbi:MAG: hypothetical protein ACRDPG_10640 [Nocardioidaceae bacterium]